MVEMQEKPDVQLLRDYAEHGDEAAFREIVVRYTDLVYSAALRQVNSPSLAEEIAQSVFVDLAGKAAAVGRGKEANASLVGWLYRSTRFATLNQLRDTRRRATHERQAMEQLITDCGPGQDWERISLFLDEAMADLSDDDREAVLLRYFKNQDFRTIGSALGLSDDAAQKRVSRAVERLREFFSKRGIAIAASGLIVLISANAVQAAPVALAATIVTAAITGTAIHGSTAVAATKIVAMTALQKALLVTTATVLVGTAVYKTHQASQWRAQVQALRQRQAPLAAEIQQLQEERDDATNQVAALTEEIAKGKSDDSELLRLRGEVGALRQQLSEYASLHSGAGPKPGENPAAPNLAEQLAEAICRGDPTALQRLADYGKSQHEFFATNSVGLKDEERGAVQTKAFEGLWKAFDTLSEEAMKGNANARRAIDQAIRMDSLQGNAATALGKLAGSGDENALQTLLDSERYGIPLASVVGALKPAAENGNEKAITLLAAVLHDETKKPLWRMASSGLLQAAASGNPVAIEALKSTPAQ